MRLVTERLVLINRQLDHARRQLDRLVRQLAEFDSADDPDCAAVGVSVPPVTQKTTRPSVAPYRRTDPPMLCRSTPDPDPRTPPLAR